MTRANIVHMRFFVTDMDAALANYDVYQAWIKPAGIMPPQSLIGIDRLVFPEMVVEVEATAAQ